MVMRTWLDHLTSWLFATYLSCSLNIQTADLGDTLAEAALRLFGIIQESGVQQYMQEEQSG